MVLNDTYTKPEEVSQLPSSGKRINYRSVTEKSDNFTTVRDQLESVFLRDWNSKYVIDVIF